MLGGLLRKLAGGDSGPKRSARLAGRLASYPAWAVPHRGTNGAYPGVPAPKLGEAEYRANLHAYLEAKPARVEVLRALLGEFGLDLGEAYDEATRDPFIRMLHLLLLAELPATFRPELAKFPAWEPSDRAGPRIVHTLLGDLAMLFADILVKAKPGCFVGMNLNPGDREMTSYGRPCLLGLSDGLFPGTHAVYDFEEEMFGVYRRMEAPEINFADAAHVQNDVGSALIGNTVLEACRRFVVEPDLPARRASGWLVKAV